MRQARAIKEKIGYPDYLDDNNMTKLDEVYAEVRHNRCFHLLITQLIILIT